MMRYDPKKLSGMQAGPYILRLNECDRSIEVLSNAAGHHVPWYKVATVCTDNCCWPEILKQFGFDIKPEPTLTCEDRKTLEAMKRLGVTRVYSGEKDTVRIWPRTPNRGDCWFMKMPFSNDLMGFINEKGKVNVDELLEVN